MKPDTRTTANRLGCALAFGCIALSVAAPARAQSADDLVKKYGCTACHAVDSTVVGPSFKEVAAKYRGQPGADAQLAARIRNGSSGVWGPAPMPPNPTVADADLGTIVKWISSQK
jgi:cytochrome c